MRLFHILMIVVLADAHHQLGVRITAFNRKDLEQCISKEAYFYTEINHLRILSPSSECSKELMEIVKYAKTIPEELNIRIIIATAAAAEHYEEEMLGMPYELCEISVAGDVNEETVKWLLIDCTENKKDDTKSRMKWFIIIIVTTVTIAIAITVGTYYYCGREERGIKQKQEEPGQQQQQQQQYEQKSLKTSSRKLNEMTDHTAPTNERTSQTKQVQQYFPEKTEKTQQLSERRQSSEEIDSSSFNSSTSSDNNH
ncbi:unnamed protein product [Litomosoides sigmodontis]|uniref:Uncharacterized protein n=1 Tax=Litomosoides sigmodontis TaxID=42156 RepID=A0A3P6U7D8_LITSI|nr:unnamed protein product [Litomosoides sigmodontis]